RRRAGGWRQPGPAGPGRGARPGPPRQPGRRPGHPPRRGPPYSQNHQDGHCGHRPRPGQRPLRAYDRDVGQTRRRGTRPDFKPDWEPFSLPEDEVLRRGGALFDNGMYWEAHEVWEEVWRMRKGRPDRDFLKGIIQGAAGMWHATQGNWKGAVSVRSRAVEYREPYRPAKDGIDVDRLSAALSEAVKACTVARDGGPAPRLSMIRLNLGGARGRTTSPPWAGP